ncbi:hypothetical protein HLK59_04795 [Streptomyces sp. S3(2020)]|uniref:hypothetical protein n=1 Tax=Streptomyces sp. S3(2020) TaxID=2732044 RepID=UPI0014886D05|nr:hypothetical protein [Streptomyces sp. S3(2020)]NNN29683.1 hypothetical protein [Streptomyces sp. S3(2020)]
MTRTTVHGTLTAEIARAVEDLPGVAFLRPGLGGRLRAALVRPEPGADPASPAGVRLARPGGTGPWLVEIHLVARRAARTVDVARAARRTVEEQLSTALPGQSARARVTVTVTGLV